MARLRVVLCRLAILMLIAFAACARRPAPADPTTRSLFRDLERQVSVSAATGWGIDRLEIDELLEGTLDSVCRVDPLARRSLREWIDGEFRRLGGPVESAWRTRGKQLSKVGDLLVLTRISLLFARAEGGDQRVSVLARAGGAVSRTPDLGAALADLVRRRRQGDRGEPG